jgi:sugar/nucleoside kinase (ribokinase family)
MAKFDITIAGEINLDLIMDGLPEVMPTERELLASAFTVTLGSSSAILAHNMAALGSRVGFITKVGADSFGELALERLRECAVDLERVVIGTNSGVTIILTHGLRRHILTYPGTISELRFEELDLEYLAQARHFHLSSLFLQRALLPQVVELFRTMKSCGLTTSLDTNDDPQDEWGGLEEILPHVDIFLPNEREALGISGASDVEVALEGLGAKVEILVIKRGSRGAIALRNGQRFNAPPVAVSMVDPVGAGDSFDAGFLHQFLHGEDLNECLRFGNLCGAYSTTAKGGTEAFGNAQRLNAFFAQHRTAL